MRPTGPLGWGASHINALVSFLITVALLHAIVFGGKAYLSGGPYCIDYAVIVLVAVLLARRLRSGPAATAD